MLLTEAWIAGYVPGCCTYCRVSVLVVFLFTWEDEKGKHQSFHRMKMYSEDIVYKLFWSTVFHFPAMTFRGEDSRNAVLFPMVMTVLSDFSVFSVVNLPIRKVNLLAVRLLEIGFALPNDEKVLAGGAPLGQARKNTKKRVRHSGEAASETSDKNVGPEFFPLYRNDFVSWSSSNSHIVIYKIFRPLQGAALGPLQRQPRPQPAITERYDFLSFTAMLRHTAGLKNKFPGRFTVNTGASLVERSPSKKKLPAAIGEPPPAGGPSRRPPPGASPSSMW